MMADIYLGCQCGDRCPVESHIDFRRSSIGTVKQEEAKDRCSLSAPGSDCRGCPEHEQRSWHQQGA